MASEFIVKPASPPCPDYAEVDRQEVEIITRPGIGKSDVVSIYRIGSRTRGGTPRADSDYDYVVIHDSDKHSYRANTTTLYPPSRRNDSPSIQHIHYTRRDLEHPSGMDILKDKLVFIWELAGKRELVWGEDVLVKWLSPDINEVFAAQQVNGETVQASNLKHNRDKIDFLPLDVIPWDTNPVKPPRKNLT
jgi:predicted nucleotidyltransferase